MKSKNVATAAVLTIRHAGDMTPAGKRRIAAWLHKQAASLMKDGKHYSPRYTARYLYF